MSHHPGCPRNQSLYATCRCAEIDMREHTDALNRNTEANVRLAALQDEMHANAVAHTQVADRIMRKLTDSGTVVHPHHATARAIIEAALSAL